MTEGDNVTAGDNKAPGLLMAGVGHRYGRDPVLRGLDLEIARGEIVCLLGPSGCGKSTSLRVAAGLEPIQEGRGEIDGKEVARPGFSVPPEHRRVGLMFQDYALFPHLRVVDNVAFGVRGGDKAAKRRAAMDLLARLGVDGYAQDFPHVLSGGEQQRVALARTIALDPSLVTKLQQALLEMKDATLLKAIDRPNGLIKATNADFDSVHELATQLGFL